ncbi:hypothetical protein PI124_g452 [Phytophthora idaei]|nr:hypothetical protein PI125_g18239 [Phytophthora idaei]KAG3174149.1 hypothetical protein PI126_g495 [Phytophthora idaei]KAG3254958.1 hypothetical protein PI124_g452 [Phytophthora idaei]
MAYLLGAYLQAPGWSTPRSWPRQRPAGPAVERPSAAAPICFSTIDGRTHSSNTTGSVMSVHALDGAATVVCKVGDLSGHEHEADDVVRRQVEQAQGWQPTIAAGVLAQRFLKQKLATC